MWTRTALSFCLLLALAAVALGEEVQGPVGANARWEGEIVLTGAVTIPPDSVLTIAAGTRIRPARPESSLSVQGTLIAQGTAEQPIVFARTKGWQGIELFEATTGSALEQVRFEGAETAISAIASSFSVTRVSFRNCDTAVKLLREASATITDSQFNDNRVGIDNQMKSRASIQRNRFSGHRETAVVVTHNSLGAIESNRFENNQQAIAVIQKFPDRIIGNTFLNNKTAIFCNQTQSTPLIRDNRFENNELALINFSFSYPVVENNRFVGNTTAIRNDQFGSPRVSHNLFRDNGTALYNHRKSNPQVEKNRLENNQTAMVCDFSSYPKVRDNNFLGNAMGVKLGLYQSADWEKRSGSKKIMAEQAAGRNSQNPLLPNAPTTFSDQVDVSGNWWGPQTAQLGRVGKEGNLPFFHDRHDQPEVSYEGFGPEKYRLDRIVFAPWLEREVADAGPENRP